MYSVCCSLYLVQVSVVGPATLRVKPDTATITATAAISLAVAARAVPHQTDHERSVVAVVSGPRVVRISEENFDIGLESGVHLGGKIGSFIVGGAVAFSAAAESTLPTNSDLAAFFLRKISWSNSGRASAPGGGGTRRRAGEVLVG